MLYRVRGFVIESELAAKSPLQASGHLLDFLREQTRVRRALDYGCGKLRYADALRGMSESLTLVDSARQLNRSQVIAGERTTVRREARRWARTQVQTIEAFAAQAGPKFDFALCSNVLSAIPSRRTRSGTLSAIRRRLKSSGRLLVVNQHTNSSYQLLKQRGDVIPHLDGWLVPRGGKASFYGLVDRDATAAFLKSSGFRIIRQWTHGQSNYALVEAR